LRILHVFDQAGVAFILAKYQQMQGHDSNVITTFNSDSDKYGIREFYKEYMLPARSEDEFIQKSINFGRSADIIHVHSRIDVLLSLRRELGLSKKIILQYHGSDIRGVKKQKLPHRSLLSDLAVMSIYKYRKIRDKLFLRHRLHNKAQSMSDVVIVSTMDLLKLVKNAIHIPNPVDVDHFTPAEKGNNSQKDALIIDTEVTDIRSALEYCKKNNIYLNIEVFNRVKNPTMYKDMPDLLRRYKIYVDIKFVDGIPLASLSKTGLEALACGLKVLDYRLQYHEKLPLEHSPTNVVSRLNSLYYKA
jgi:glycosyltransferase involved in cell wall biosynthesis